MHEELHLAAYRFADALHLFKGQLPFKDYAGAAQGFEVFRPLYVPDGALGRGVERHGDVLPAADSAVADDEGVRARLLSAKHLAVGLLKLGIFYDGVEGHEDSGPETVGIVAEFADVLETVACGLPCPEVGTGDIYGIGTAVDSRDADFLISGRSQ